MSIATTCAIENCTRPIRDKKHSWCYLHYRRNLDHGDPLYERDQKEQADNRSTNDIVTFRGVEDTLKNHAIKSGIKYRTVWQRIHRYNWTVEDALTKKKED